MFAVPPTIYHSASAKIRSSAITRGARRRLLMRRSIPSSIFGARLSECIRLRLPPAPLTDRQLSVGSRAAYFFPVIAFRLSVCLTYITFFAICQCNICKSQPFYLNCPFYSSLPLLDFFLPNDILFSLRSSSRCMLSRCLNITNTAIANAKIMFMPGPVKRYRSSGYISMHIMEPSETYFVEATIRRNTASSTKKTRQSSISTITAEVTTPLPPLNL